MSELHYTSSSPFASRNQHPSGETALLRFANLLAEWRERRRGRAALAQMSEGMLKDIGLSSGDASSEWEKPFWRA
jgi:uncharacterized protein YjiS (DUF1127 family)